MGSRQEPIALLLVTSDRILITEMLPFLRPPEFACSLAPDGAAALGQMRSQTFTLVLCDLRLPDTNGLELMRRAQARDPRASFLMIASYREWSQAIEAMRMGAYDCLERPFRKEVWLRRINHAIRRKQNEMEREVLRSLLESALEAGGAECGLSGTGTLNVPRATLETLVMAIDAREHMSHLHSLRVQAYTLLLAERCGYVQTRLPELAVSALLHDIGKIVIPDSILLKPGLLTPDEFAVMRQHTVRGHQILSRIPQLQGAAQLALTHHERMDGNGYPRGLRGEQIPLEVRIFAVADAFDVILSGRPYREPLTLEAARAEIARCAGTQFDSDVVDIFLQISASDLAAIPGKVAEAAPPPGLLVADSSQPAAFPARSIAACFPLARQAAG